MLKSIKNKSQVPSPKFQKKALKDLEKYKKKAEQHLEGWKRALADYQNLQRESTKEREQTVRFANLNLLLGLLPIIDNLKLALNHLPKELEQDNWVMGISHINRQFDEFLNDMGVTEIPTLGEKFDPCLHEAIDKEKHKDKESGEILKEVSKGYIMKEEVIVAAKVIVVE